MTPFKIHYCLLAFALLAFLSVPVRADLVTFTSRPAFNAAAPGLPFETFESASVAPGAVITCMGPVSSTMGGGCFPVAGLLPGAIYNASVATQPNLVVLGAAFASVGNASRVLGPNRFADTFNITFGNANAVGFDVFAPTGGTFFGVISTTINIGRINIASANNGGELVDNVAFGRTGPAVPEPMTILLLGTGLGG